MSKHIIYVSSFLAALALNVLCFYKGIYSLPQLLYVIPIVLGVFLYGRKGLFLPILTLAVSILPLFFFHAGAELILTALISSGVYLGIALLVYVLHTRNTEDIQELHKGQKLLNTILSSIRDGIIVTDAQGNIAFINEKAKSICALKDKETANRPLAELLTVYSEDGTVLPLCVRDNLNTDKALHIANGCLIQEDKSRREVELYITPVFLEGDKKEGSSIVFHDITDKKRAEEEIQFLTYHDKLTGLYNRRFFETELIKLDAPKNYPISIIIADVNGLKLTNDAFGHKAGDRLLIAAAESLLRVCRQEDILARWGGDEYIMLLPNTGEAKAAEIIQKVYTDNRREIIENVSLSVSLGFAVKHYNEEDIGEVIKQADDMMYKEKLSVSRSIKNRTVNIILQTLYVKNEAEREHSMRISRLVNRLEGTLNLTKNQITDLRVLGQIHDIGKIAIDESILNKNGKLSEQEYEVVKRHSEKGYQIIKASPELMYLADEVLCHHERYDGYGYPRGLKRNEIPKLARILAVADAIEAMLSDRPYRKALTLEETMIELKDNSGTQFDPEVVEVFLKVLPSY